MRFIIKFPIVLFYILNLAYLKDYEWLWELYLYSRILYHELNIQYYSSSESSA